MEECPDGEKRGDLIDLCRKIEGTVGSESRKDVNLEM